MKRTVKTWALIIIALALLVIPVGAEEVENRATSYFMSSTALLEKTSTTKFEAWFSVRAYEVMDELGASSIKIQRSLDGSSWTTVKTYSKASYPYLIGQDTGIHSAFVTYTGTTGYHYRAKITLYAKQGNGIGELVRYTSAIKL